MKLLSMLLLSSVLFSSAQAASLLTGVAISEMNGNDPNVLLGTIQYQVIGAITSAVISTFNPTAGLILLGDNGEYILNEAAPEVVEAKQKAELELELSELDVLILEKLEELNN